MATNKSKDTLGDRMKGYENISRIYLTKRMPVIIRVDGRAFHTLTKGFKKPFDHTLIIAMQETAKDLCKEISGCKLAYVQSDEISLLLTDYDTINTTPWFDNNLQKLSSISASIATLSFNKHWYNLVYTEYAVDGSESVYNAHCKAIDKGATFDARAFVLPREEVCNYFIWRQQDATRNSINMLAQSLYSHKELQGVNNAEKQDKMMLEKGVNWNDCTTVEKRGSCIVKKFCAGDKRPTWAVDKEIPIFTQDRNYIDKYVNILQNWLT